MKIKIVSSIPHGACSFYRSHGVFPRIVETEGVQTLSWQILMDADVLYLERPDTPAFHEAGKIAKEMGVKLWVDFDDNLFCLPAYNPHLHFYNRATQKIIIKNIQLADIITVATPAIAEELLCVDKKIDVIPNAHNDYIFPFEYHLSKSNIIIWRGSGTHRGDLLPYSNQIWDVANKSKWNWEFIGNNLWYITDNIRRKNILPEMNLPLYFKTIKNMNPAIYIVPLDFNNFNRSKSNCGWLEMTYAGAVTLAPNMPEWIRPGIVNYDTPEDFQSKLELLMANEGLRERNYKKSFEYIKDNLLLSIVNEQRKQILNKIIARQ